MVYFGGKLGALGKPLPLELEAGMEKGITGDLALDYKSALTGCFL